MKQLKIKKEFWDKIVSGEKQYEFRKLSKGLGSGTHRFLIIDGNINVCDDCNYCGGRKNLARYWQCPIRSYPYQKKYYGYAKLRPIAVNPFLSESRLGVPNMMELENSTPEIDKETYDFVNENYVEKGIDFIAYEISEVENVN